MVIALTLMVTFENCIETNGGEKSNTDYSPLCRLFTPPYMCIVLFT